MPLANRVAVITGATGGLGCTVSRQLAVQDVNLALLDMDAEKLTALAAHLPLPRERILTRSVNLLDRAETNAAAAEVYAQFGRIDILLHFVGGWVGGKTLVDSPSADLEFMLNQHVWTSFNVVRVFVPYLVKNGWGRVIMVTSPYAQRPRAKGGPYAIGKAGQEALILALAQELRDTGVTANLLQAKTIDVQRVKVSAPTSENITWVTPEELSAAILYLLSDEAGTINGARLPMYGGFE